MRRIVVLGAGYAGMIAAAGLAGRTRRRRDVAITLVTASDRFAERLRLHQAASGQRLAELRIPELVRGSGIAFERGWVTGIDLGGRVVRIDDEREIGFDTLIYALGSVTDPDAVPGAREHAYGIGEATLIASRLAGMRDGRLVVCGSGLTGLETAAEIAGQYPGLGVTLAGREAPGSRMRPGAKAHLDRALRRLGVAVRSGVEITQIRPDGIVIAGGESIPADLVIWTGGVRAPALAAEAGLTADDQGRIVTDACLRSVSHSFVYAVGDAAAVTQRHGVLHGTCQSGMPTGVHAATQIVRELNGRAPRPFRFGYVHAPVSLGRDDAVVQFTRADDSPARGYLTGRAAVWYKETVTASPWQTFRRTLRFPRHATLGWRR
ncbi:FAD-dependent oxidoreductase [Actinoplanes sp. NPDC051851]|uniref:NAD(P)/FAD-dependent oxidoreductase n=1 Tax=Actinoplanes sp. NPDC051851 TaxID=3154753 RepID=UPI003429B194